MSNSIKQSNDEVQQINAVKKRGRPKKIRSASELKKIEKARKPKLSLAEKQAAKLKVQKERQAAKNGEPKNKARFYCNNKDLQAELIKWRDSNINEEKKILASGGKIDYTKRILSEELGKMLINISQKVLNHSNFRNYSKELKEDMQGFFFYKAIKGLKNYNFEFNNPFAWLTQCAFNSYVTVITRHYKQLNIKKDLMAKLLTELQTYNGIDPRSALNRCIMEYIENEPSLLEDE